MQYKIEVKNDRSMPGFWEVCVTDNSGAIVFMEYADSKAEAQAKGDVFVATKQGKGMSKSSSIGGGGSSNYATLDEVLLAYNQCKITKREAQAEMKKINPALSPNDIEDILVVDNPNPPNCGSGSDAVYPHSMYDCETGKEYIAYNEEKHDYYASLGYVHDLEKDCNGNGVSTQSEGPFGLFAYDWLLTERNRFILIGAFTIWLIYYYGRD